MTRIGTVPPRGGIDSCEAQGRRRNAIGGEEGGRSARGLGMCYSRRSGHADPVVVIIVDKLARPVAR